MARTLFIVQGEGRGHLSQAVALKEYLEDAGHSVETVFAGSNSSRPLPDYFKEDFGERLKLFSSPWFLRTPNKKGIYIFRTLLFNLTRIFKYLGEVKRIRREIVRTAPDVVVNFYDVVGALALRKIPKDIRRIGIGHHFSLHLEGYPCKKRNAFHRALLVMHTRVIMKSCDRVLALSFRERAGNDQISVVPPLVRKEFREAHYEKGPDYLVYLLNEGYIVDLIRLARKVPKQVFNVFSDLPAHIPVPKGIRLHPVNDRAFREKMLSCRAVISTSGFDTVAEAACMGVPLAVVPVENHFEQLCNSMDVERSGVGEILKDFTEESLDRIEGRDQSAFRQWVNQAGIQILKHISG